jgi:hypothetical protein
MAVVGAIGLILTAPGWWPVIPLLAVGGWAASRRLAPRYVIEVQLDDAPKLSLSEEQIEAIRLGWNPESFELTLMELPGDTEWHGPHAEVLLQMILDRNSRAHSPKVIAACQRFAEQVGDSTGILRMLEPLRIAQDNRVDLATIPVEYQVALDMLLAPDIAFLGEELSDRKEEAARVAAEAEGLDRMLKSG